MAQAVTHLKLPFEFEVASLKQDLAVILNQDWIPHFNKEGYTGNWKAVPLYAAGGQSWNIYANPDQEVMPTEVLSDCPYFAKVIDSLKCKVISARILRLEVGAEIKPHRDFDLGYEDGCFRIHVPILTNPGVEFILDDHRLDMQAGECWYTNVNYVHSVKNTGDTDRFHLVMDYERNPWSDDLFFKLADKEGLLSGPTKKESKENLLAMISELELSDAPIAATLIAEAKKKLNQFQSYRSSGGK